MMTSPRYGWTMSSELLEAAVSNVNEPRENEGRLAEIDKLRSNFEEKYPSIELTRKDDGFLLRFLRSCNFDQDLSLKRLHAYLESRKEWPELFELVDDKQKLESFAKSGSVLSPVGRAKDGSFIIIKRPGLGLESNDKIENYAAAVYLSYETLIQNEEAQIFGFTVIADMSHLGLRTGMKLASISRKLIKMLQDVLPIQIKSLNVVNNAFIFGAVYAVASQFMNSKLKEKIKFHKRHLEGLQEKIGSNILPEFLGGTGPEIDVEEWGKKILKE